MGTNSNRSRVRCAQDGCLELTRSNSGLCRYHMQTPAEAVILRREVADPVAAVKSGAGRQGAWKVGERLRQTSTLQNTPQAPQISAATDPPAIASTAVPARAACSECGKTCDLPFEKICQRCVKAMVSLSADQMMAYVTQDLRKTPDTCCGLGHCDKHADGQDAYSPTKLARATDWLNDNWPLVAFAGLVVIGVGCYYLNTRGI